MGPLLTTLFGKLLEVFLKPLGILIGYLIVKRQGAKEATLEGKAEVLEDTKEALEDLNDIRNMPDADLSNIVFYDPERPK